MLGFDCGPGNALLDLWCERHTGQPFDADGAWAASGQVLPIRCSSTARRAVLRLAPPKSTGRDLFNRPGCKAHLSAFAASRTGRRAGDAGRAHGAALARADVLRRAA